MVAALSHAGHRAADLGVLAAVALGLWLALLAVLAAATRPNLPRAQPATSQLAGDESPAVVSFLVHRWEVSRSAVPATLLDLAARKVVAIDQVAPDRFICRTRSAAATTALAPYEQQVLDHVRSLAAADGVVACEALTTGPEAESAGWWQRFEKSVVADARRRGLSRSRWGRAAILVLSLGALVPAGLAAAAVVAAPTQRQATTSSSPSSSSSSTSSSKDNPVGAAIGLTLLAWGALMTLPFRLRAERDTPAGEEAAGKWLGVRDYLHGDKAFDQAPPAAVAIWDRYLAYGAAMGVAAGAVRALPLGAESDHEAWSAYGGQWHVVRVRYPGRFPPGWGQHPAKAALKGLFVLAVAALVVGGAGPGIAKAVGDLLDSVRNEGRHALALGIVAGAGVLVGVAALAVLRAAALAVYGVSDLFARRQVEGLVIRQRAGYVALDDGRHARVRAWRVEPGRLGGARRGSVVRVTVSPRLGHVFHVEPVQAATHAVLT